MGIFANMFAPTIAPFTFIDINAGPFVAGQSKSWPTTTFPSSLKVDAILVAASVLHLTFVNVLARPLVAGQAESRLA